MIKVSIVKSFLLILIIKLVVIFGHFYNNFELSSIEIYVYFFLFIVIM